MKAVSEFEDKVNSILNDPQQMEKIAGLAKSLMGGEAQQGVPESSGNGMASAFSSLLGGDDNGFDIGKISRILSASAGVDDEKQALLNAIKPYLSEKRQRKMDKAMKIAKLASIAKFAMGEMGDGNV